MRVSLVAEAATVLRLQKTRFYFILFLLSFPHETLIQRAWSAVGDYIEVTDMRTHLIVSYKYPCV